MNLTDEELKMNITLLNIFIDDKLFELIGYERHEIKFATAHYINFDPEFSAQFKAINDELKKVRNRNDIRILKL